MLKGALLCCIIGLDCVAFSVTCLHALMLSHVWYNIVGFKETIYTHNFYPAASSVLKKCYYWSAKTPYRSNLIKRAAQTEGRASMCYLLKESKMRKGIM